MTSRYPSEMQLIPASGGIFGNLLQRKNSMTSNNSKIPLLIVTSRMNRRKRTSDQWYFTKQTHAMETITAPRMTRLTSRGES